MKLVNSTLRANIAIINILINMISSVLLSYIKCNFHNFYIYLYLYMIYMIF